MPRGDSNWSTHVKPTDFQLISGQLAAPSGTTTDAATSSRTRCVLVG
ncbi:hypothetical protein SAMN05216188_13340 [Lentzea xinjiangensis]|uniref:Uncharacterized protein n=1 Tax=Lentzea xinjiangensis TaxID=402600 RepID=A0A1H9WG86_9PSEU|nr:hypothetical protein SAMN05216188_13340 [Lentzea xinjiangensis]